MPCSARSRGYSGRHTKVAAGTPGRHSVAAQGGYEKRLRSWTRLLYCSRMCSTPDARIALLGQAIDELAQQTRTGTHRGATDGTGPDGAGQDGAGPDGGDTDAGMEGVAQRLAAIWAMVAELDSGLAARLPRYVGPAD